MLYQQTVCTFTLVCVILPEIILRQVMNFFPSFYGRNNFPPFGSLNDVIIVNNNFVMLKAIFLHRTKQEAHSRPTPGSKTHPAVRQPTNMSRDVPVTHVVQHSMRIRPVFNHLSISLTFPSHFINKKYYLIHGSRSRHSRPDSLLACLREPKIRVLI